MLKRIAEKTLENGLKVLCLKKSSAPIVSVQVWFRVGSAYERDGTRGISHCLEHMMFRGSENVGPEEHAKRVNNVGGHCNAFTAEDMTAYIDSVPKEYLDMVLSLEADRMRSLRLDPDVLETERKVIVEEYHTYMNNPVTKAFLEFRKAFYGDHPYAVSPLGVIEDIRRISVDDCRAMFERYYSPSRALIVVVGDFESERDLFARIEKHFGGVAARDGEETCGKESVAHAGTGRMTRRVEFDVPMLIMGFPTPPSSHPDALPLEILQLAVSQGETSRLHREIVRNQSVAVMAGGMNHLMKHSGMSLFFAAHTPDVSAVRVERALDGQIARVQRDGITSTEMTKVKNTTLSSRVFELYSAEHICQRIGFSESVEGDYRLWVERLEALEHLEADALVETARKYWDRGNKHVLCLKPKRAKPLLFALGIARRLFGRKR